MQGIDFNNYRDFVDFHSEVVACVIVTRTDARMSRKEFAKFLGISKRKLKRIEECEEIPTIEFLYNFERIKVKFNEN